MTDNWLQQQESSRIWHFFRFDFFNFIMSPPHLLDSKIFLFYTHKTQSTAAFGNDDNLKPFNGGSIAVIRTRRDQINWSSWHNGGMIFNISQLVLTFPFSLKKRKKILLYNNEAKIPQLLIVQPKWQQQEINSIVHLKITQLFVNQLELQILIHCFQNVQSNLGNAKVIPTIKYNQFKLTN